MRSAPVASGAMGASSAGQAEERKGGRGEARRGSRGGECLRPRCGEGELEEELVFLVAVFSFFPVAFLYSVRLVFSEGEW